MLRYTVTMEIQKLAEWNPWWESKEIIKDFLGKPRPEYKSLINSTEIKEIIIITGIRRSGKSTLMYQMIENLFKKGISSKQILFINLEDKKLTNDSLEEIYEAYKQEINPDEKTYIFLDEIHKKQGWESWIRKKYDLKTKDKFIISGSCSYLLKKEYSTLLTGRNLTFEIFPLGFREYLFFKNIEVNKNSIKKGLIQNKTKFLILKNLNEYLYLGGFPEIIIKQKEYQMKILKQYFDDILYKDIIDRYNLNPQKSEDLALFLITNFTSLISLRNTRNSLDMSYDTIKNYLSYFKEAYLFFILNKFSYSFKEQKSVAPKIYCIDNGLRNAVSFKFSKDYGKLAENLVFVELRRRNKNIYYWKEKSEVDFVIKNSDHTLNAIKVTYNDEIDKREIQGLLNFKNKYKKCRELILITKNLEKEEKIDNKKIKFIPLWKWLLE